MKQSATVTKRNIPRTRGSIMEETLQRLAVGVFGWIATDTLQDVDLMMGIVSKGRVIITLTILSIYKDVEGH